MSILGTPENYITTAGSVATTFAASAGSSRVVALVINHEQTATNRNLATVTLGSQSATLAARGNRSSSPVNFVEVWYILEANIGSIGSSPTLTITTANGGNTVVAATIFTLGGCDQTPANWTSGGPTSDSFANAVSFSLTTATDATVIGGITGSVGGSGFTCGTALTEVTGSDRDFNAASRAVTFYAIATSSSMTVDGDSSSTSGSAYQTIFAVSVPPASSAPTISSTSDDTPTDGSTLTLTVTNAEASQGTGGVTANGVGWTETSWSDTSVQVTVALGDNKYGVNVPLVLTNNSGQSSSAYNVQIQPATGKAYVNLSGTLASSGDRLTATPDLASGDQVEISNVVGGTISDVTVNVDASFSVTSGVTAFDIRVNDGTGWGSVATQYVAEPGSDATSKRGLVRALVRPLTFDIARDISA